MNDTNQITIFKYLLYTIIVFLVLMLTSYVAFSQQKLSMKQAVELAMKNNREVKITELRSLQAKEQIRVANSLRLPQVSAGVQVAHYFTEPAFFGFNGNGGGSDKIGYSRFGGRDQASGVLSLYQPVYNAASAPEKRKALLEEKSSKLAVTATQTDIGTLVKETYIRLLVLRERIKLQQESLERNEKALEDARSLLAQGRALRVDTLRAYTSVKNLEPDLLRLSYAIEVGKQDLRKLTGIDSLQQIELSDSLVLGQQHLILSEDEIVEQSKQTRADLKALQIQPDIDQESVTLAASAKKPVVGFTGQYLVQTQASKFDYINAYYPSTPYVGLQLTVPIFNGYRNNARIQQAKLSKQQSQFQLQEALVQLRTEVKKVVSDLHETRARLQTRINVEQTAKLSYEITQYRYTKGVASRLELTDAELALTQAQSDYLEAVYDHLLARINLERVTGKVE
jgi:outer membrane protein TolC